MRNTVLAGLAVLVLAIGVGIYVMMTPKGNEQLASNTGTGAPSCTASLTKAKKLDPFVKGDVAGFVIAEEANSLAELRFNDNTGKPVTLSEFQGQTILVNLWATWCVPCREEMPDLEALQKEEGSDRFQVVPISMDNGDDQKPKAFYEEIGLEALPFYHDGTLGIFTGLRKRGLVLGLPTSILLDKESCILGVLNGYAHWNGPEAKAFIKAASEL